LSPKVRPPPKNAFSGVAGDFLSSFSLRQKISRPEGKRKQHGQSDSFGDN
jgi:hypothetical protein